MQSTFEAWSSGERFHAVVSVQAWHWVDPAVRYGLAHRVLAPGGTPAAVWAFPDWERCAACEALSGAYRSVPVGLRADFPMHPDAELHAASTSVASRARRYPRRERSTTGARPETVRACAGSVIGADRL